MPAADTATALTGFPRRGAGTDSERRAAAWLRDQAAGAARTAALETFWCRPNWALAHAWHVLLAIVGSLITISDPRLGGALLLVALLSIVADVRTGRSPGRRLTREHASQNVVSRRVAPSAAPPVHLIITANYDAGRAGLAHRRPLRAAAAVARGAASDGRLTPGWLGWLAIELVWLLVVAGLRDGGATGTAIAVAQLLVTVALVLELALLLDLGSADFGPGAGDNASGAAVALALVRALDAAPPRRLAVELVLQGAGDGQMLGLARHLRARRGELYASNAVVIGIGPCGSGTARWWASDGPLVPLAYHRQLRRLAATLVGDAPHGAHHGRGCGPALPGRRAGLPSITLGCLDDRGLVPNSHRATDEPDTLDPVALDAVLGLGLMLVDALDAELSDTPAAVPASE